MAKQRTPIDFIGKRKLFLFISLGIILAGLVVNVIFGTELDINFKGGTIYSYNYADEIITEENAKAITDEVFGNEKLEISFSKDITGNENQVTITMAEIPETIVTYNFDKAPLATESSVAESSDATSSAPAKVYVTDSAKADIEALIKANLDEDGKFDVTFDYENGTLKFVPADPTVANETSLNKLTAAFNEKYPDSKFQFVSSNSVTDIAAKLTEKFVDLYGTKIVYAYTAEKVEDADISAVKTKAKEFLGQDFNVVNDAEAKTLTLTPVDSSEKAGMQVINAEAVKKLTDAFAAEDTLKDLGATLSSERYNAIYLASSNSVKANVGRGFFVKCLFAAALGGVLVTVYLGFRFRKIGGASAGVFALLALLHDVIIAYLVYVIFRIPLDDNFIAVVLTILGYSLNGTIVIYDRIRENEQIFGRTKSISEIVNKSVNETFTRNIYTTLATFASVVVICIVAKISGLDSIISFAFPMAIGILAGCYSSVLLSSPLWAAWREYRLNKKIAAAQKDNK